MPNFDAMDVVNARRLDDALASCSPEVVTERVAAHLAERMGAAGAGAAALDIAERVKVKRPDAYDQARTDRGLLILGAVALAAVLLVFAMAGAVAVDAAMGQVEAWRAWR